MKARNSGLKNQFETLCKLAGVPTDPDQWVEDDGIKFGYHLAGANISDELNTFVTKQLKASDRRKGIKA